MTSTPAISTDLAIIGGGPAGYSAAFRAADLGLSVTLIEKEPMLGGVCLRAGCIPSKTLLDVASTINQARESARMGVSFGPANINLKALVEHKDRTIARLGRGLKQLADTRSVSVINATARFASLNQLTLTSDTQETSNITFQHAIIACGSTPRHLPMLPLDPRIFFSEQALELASIPKRLVILGAGIVGLELGTIYQALGSDVTFIELALRILPFLPADTVRPLERQLKRQRQTVITNAQLTDVTTEPQELILKINTPRGEQTLTADALLVATGRQPNSASVDPTAVGLAVNPNGAFQTDSLMRTSVPHIYAAGDVTDGPMLAHRAIHDGCQIAEHVAGIRSTLDTPLIPSVLYTDPQIAWVGNLGAEQMKPNPTLRIGAFPWSANGRAASMGRHDGLTRIVADASTGCLLGAQITGPHAGDLISELTLAIDAGLTYQQVTNIIHPHPTLSETIGSACALLAGQCIDLPPNK